MKETKVICPKCGTEFEIAEHEYVSAGVVIGKDSGLGTVVLKAAGEAPVTKAQKRMEALKAAGIDTSGLFAMQTGDIARLDNGVLSVVPEDDPIYSAIINGGTIPDRHLFRRWVMAQMFHLLIGDFTKNLRRKGYEYQWHMIEDELKVQSKLYYNDKENFVERNKWFNQRVVISLCEEYLCQLRKRLDYLKKNKTHTCKGVPYIKFGGKNIFISDLYNKVIAPVDRAISKIKYAADPVELYVAYTKFKKVYVRMNHLKMDTAFIDAYKGVGAYYTMKNLVLFHGCNFVDKDGKKLSQSESMRYLAKKADQYASNSEGWRLFGVMKKLLQDNHIDIQKKIDSWSKD